MRTKTFALAVVIILSAALLAVNLSAASVKGGAHWSGEVVKEAAWGTPVIDGVISKGEWDLAPVITVTLDDPIVNKYGLYQGGWETNKSNAADFSTEVRFLWDENSLYIYENRIDDDVILAGSSETPWSGADGNLIFLQVADDDSALNPKGWAHHIFYIVGNDSGKEGGATAVRIVNESDGSRNTVKNNDIKAVAKKNRRRLGNRGRGSLVGLPERSSRFRAGNRLRSRILDGSYRQRQRLRFQSDLLVQAGQSA